MMEEDGLLFWVWDWGGKDSSALWMQRVHYFLLGPALALAVDLLPSVTEEIVQATGR